MQLGTNFFTIAFYVAYNDYKCYLLTRENGGFMIIHVVQPGETIGSIAEKYDVTTNRLITDNELPNPNNLVVGQNIVVLYPAVTHIVEIGDTLYEIAQKYGVTPTQILQNNPKIAESDVLIPGEELVITYEGDNETDGKTIGNIVINGYAYPFIDRTVLKKTLPYLTYLSLFTYGFTPEGDLIPIDDKELIQIARSYGVAPIMMLAPMTKEGAFSNAIAHAMFINPVGQDKLINNILAMLEAKNYAGIDIDFEFVLPEDKQLFIDFIAKLKSKLEPEGYIVLAALAPKTSATQAGLLYEAHDYAAIGAIVDLVLLMTYEWGYTYGPPMATAPVNNVRQVLEYGVSEISPEKILMGLPNYAYDWPLPFIRGKSVAESIGNVEAVQRALEHKVDIQFDPVAQAPYYYYTDAQGVAHVVWFDDASSIQAKVKLIPELGLNGIGYWQIMKFFPQSWLVINTLFNIEKVV